MAFCFLVIEWKEVSRPLTAMMEILRLFRLIPVVIFIIIEERIRFDY